MTELEVLHLTKHLHSIYEDHFPLLNAATLAIWVSQLRTTTADDAQAAVTRWVTQHRRGVEPTLDELIDTAERIADERVRFASRSSDNRGDFAGVLVDAAKALAANPTRTPDEVTYGQVM